MDGDFFLTESVAMLMYLTREKRVEDHWYLGNTKDQARVHETHGVEASKHQERGVTLWCP